MPPAKDLPIPQRVFARTFREIGHGLSALAGTAHLWSGLPDKGKVRVLKNVPYTERGGRQAVDVFLPAKTRPDGKPHPFLFFIHGGGWVMGDRRMGAVTGRLLASRGIAVVSAGYRLAPGHGLAHQLDDLQRAISFVHQKAHEWGIDPKHYALAGESAGGHLTLRLAQEFPAGLPKPRAVVGIYGLYDFDSWRKAKTAQQRLAASFFLTTVKAGDPAEEFLDRHHAHRELPWRDVPVLLLHGEADGLVPVGQSHKLAKLLKEQGVDVTVKTYPGRGHAFNYSPRGSGRKDSIDFYKTLMVFLHDHVVPRSKEKAA